MGVPFFDAREVLVVFSFDSIFLKSKVEAPRRTLLFVQLVDSAMLGNMSLTLGDPGKNCSGIHPYEP